MFRVQPRHVPGCGYEWLRPPCRERFCRLRFCRWQHARRWRRPQSRPFVFQHKFELHFGQKIGFVFAAAIGFGMAFLTAVSAHFRDRHTLHADLDESVLNLLQTGWVERSLRFWSSLSSYWHRVKSQEAGVALPPGDRIPAIGQLAKCDNGFAVASSGLECAEGRFLAIPLGAPKAEMTYSG